MSLTPPPTPTYSFQDVQCTLSGPGGVLNLGDGAGDANEGITFAHTGEKDTLTDGADGTIMHSLHASMAGRITIRLLKTSPQNAALSQLYNFQRSSSANWGQNIIRLSSTVLGDVIGGSQMAFVKHPNVVYATEGNTNDWEFSGYVVPELAAGIPGLAANI